MMSTQDRPMRVTVSKSGWSFDFVVPASQVAHEVARMRRNLGMGRPRVTVSEVTA